MIHPLTTKAGDGVTLISQRPGAILILTQRSWVLQQYRNLQAIERNPQSFCSRDVLLVTPLWICGH